MKEKYHTPLKIGLLVCALIFLGGCENPYVKQLRSEFGWNEARMVSDGWLEGRRIETDPIYCYETIGNVDCYPVQRKTEIHRQTVRVDSTDF